MMENCVSPTLTLQFIRRSATPIDALMLVRLPHRDAQARGQGRARPALRERAAASAARSRGTDVPRSGDADEARDDGDHRDGRAQRRERAS